jgi:hypothetical protein
MRTLAFCFLLAGLYACSPDRSNDRLADAYVDLLRFRDRAAQADTSALQTGIDSILSAHGYTSATYREGFVLLADGPDRLQAFFARVEARLAETNPALQPTP